MECNNNLLKFVASFVLILLHATVSLGNDKELAAELINLYNGMESQLQTLRGEAANLQNAIAYYQAEVKKLGKNTQSAASYDQAMILEIAQVQVKRGDDLEKLLKAKDLWQKNFAVLNKTFANMGNKVG